MTPALAVGGSNFQLHVQKRTTFPPFFFPPYCPEPLYLVEWWKLKQTPYKTSPWPGLHQDRPGDSTEGDLRGPPILFAVPRCRRAPRPEEPSQVVPRGGGTHAWGSGSRRDVAVLSPGEGRGWPRGHVPHLWDFPPLWPRGSPAGTSESRPAPLFTIYSQSEHEATAGSLESPAPAPGAPSTALAFNIFLSFPLSPGSSQRGVTRARWNFILFLPK